IQDTVERLKGIVETNNIFIVTNKKQKPEIIRQLSFLPEENIIDEPFGRNTAACIGLSALILKSKDPDSIMITLPADHLVRDLNSFHKTLQGAINFAYNSKGLVTIGITPSRPETGYGYIQIDEKEVEENIHKVYTFAEKPNYATAVRFLESGDFLWNSGMFIWRVDSILEEMRIHLPDLYEGLEKIEKDINTEDFEKTLINVYGQLRNISIDYGIMEKSSRVFLTKGNFVWSDVGSWEEVYQLSGKDDDGNAIKGNAFTDMTVDTLIYSPNKFTAAIGVENLIIVNTDDAVLVCRRDHSQDVRKVVDHLKINKLTEHL
ncbi:MAG TPA: sugar phosphate nucleotidyltransferase, partial [Ignavibacteriaceae bacterium]|nr:sugar phosphate nucleotidyltransferase [Ignavibacteriaceae bacterium]